MKTLILYASKYGATGEIARRIAEKMPVSYTVSTCGEFLRWLLCEAGIERQICLDMNRFE